MAIQVQLRRGTTTQNNAFTGALAEVTVDTTNSTLRVHDGVTSGGAAVVGTTATQTLTNKTLSDPTLGGNVSGTANISVTGLMSATGNITGGNLVTAGLITATGNITSTANVAGGNLVTGGRVVATGNIVATANVTGGNITTAGLMTATGTITSTANVVGGNLVTAGVLNVNSGGAVTAIVNGASNAVGNIGSSTGYFNTAFVKATSAQYADLAEIYIADATYEPGTVLSFGGNKEVTLCQLSNDARVAGVVSTNPAYIMNSAAEGEHTAVVALTGKVPTRVTGFIQKGDMIVSAGNGVAMACANPAIGTVIGKSLEDFLGDSGVINVVVGRI